MTADTSMVAAFAAICGSLVGGCTSLATTFVGQRMQARWSRAAAELNKREELYGKLVEESVPLFIDALKQPGLDPAKMMRFFSIMGRIRLTSNEEVLRAAEDVSRRLLEAYEKPPVDPVTVLEQYAADKEHLDPLLDFTKACRQERAKILQQI
jgi:hypothetical protein